MTFADEVRLERSRLALLDPAGERDAIAPLDGVRARQRLLEDADRQARRRALIRDAWSRRPPDGQELLAALGVDPGRARGITRCPAHEDRSPSLSWRLTDTGRALLHCHAGCTFAEILEAIR
jgi:hypothetical protein